MQEGWKTYKLSEVTDFIGRGISPKYSEKEGIRVVNQRCIRKNKIIFETCRLHDLTVKGLTEKKFLKKNDVLVNSTGVGTLGRVAQYKESYEQITVDSHVSIVRPKLEYCDEYFGYAIIGNQKRIEELGEGSTGQTELSRIRLGEDIKLCIPNSKQERKAIASILSALDDKIELNLQMNKTLEEMAMALYKHWFVDFGPFQDGEFVDSELGKIPKGWEVKELGEVAIKKSQSFDFSNIQDVVFVNTGDVQKGRFLHSNIVSKKGLPGQAKKAISKDDILYSEIRPKNKRFAYVNFEASNYVVSTKFMIINANDNMLNKLLYRFLTKQSTVDEFNTIAEGRSGTFPQITFDAISGMQLVLPPIEVQREFQDVVGAIEDMQDSLYVENQTLTKLRDTMLPKLISGEVRVKDIEQTIANTL